MKYLVTFNTRLRELRQKKKLSQEDIAAFCHVDVTVVNGWEQPTARPGVILSWNSCWISVENGYATRDHA